MIKKILFFGLPVLVVLLYIYYNLGGFEEPYISVVETEELMVAGSLYQGPFEEDSLQETFLKVRDFVANGQLTGTVAVINYRPGFAPKDSIHQLIGVKVKNPPEDLPEGWQVDTLRASRVVRAVIDVHPLARPTPEDTYELLVEFARKQALETKSIIVEYYVDETTLWVDIPVR